MKLEDVINEINCLQHKLEDNINLLGQILREINLAKAFKE